MWTNAELKEKGKAAFKNNYWRCVLVALILSILTAGSTTTGQSNQIKNADTSNIPNEQAAAIMTIVAGIIVVFAIVWILLRIFLLNPLEVGCQTFLKENLNEPVKLDRLKAGFSDYKRVVYTIFLRDCYLALWFLLLIIPGIIKSYSYRMVPFILMDDPELSTKEVITKSREMMNGQKWRAFLLDLSFIGWFILGILTCGLVSLFYADPYMRSTRAALYVKLRDNA